MNTAAKFGIVPSPSDQCGSCLPLMLAISAKEQDVATRVDGPDGGLTNAVVIGNGLHVEIVADDDTALSELLSKNFAQHGSGQGRRHLIVNGAEQHVGAHDHRHPRSGRHGEWDKLDGAQALERVR